MAKNQSPCVSKGIQGLVWEAGYLKDMLSFFYSNVKAKMRLLLREGTLFLAVKTRSKKIPTPPPHFATQTPRQNCAYPLPYVIFRTNFTS
jgi:hypothetical protein